MTLLALLLLAQSAGSLPDLERAPRPQELLAYPEDGQSIEVNPPGFCWTPHENARAYRLDVWRNGRAVITTEALTSTVYPPRQALAPGEYSWRVLYLGADGAPYGASQTRRFSVRRGLPELPMPDIARLKAQLAGVRPRLFLAGKRLEAIRAAAAAGKAPSWAAFLTSANAALEEKPYPEPAGYPKGEFSAAEWRRIYAPGKAGSAHLARTALAWRITSDRKYLEGARRWMMTLAGWDPRGITSHRLRLPDGSEGNDEASMPMLERMSMGWDWIGDQLTAEERARVLGVMTERGNQVLEILKKQDFLSHPFSNHEGRVLAFLGLAGLSFLGDIPDADHWLDYVLRCYLTSYPGWGGDQGGWAQGVSYWSSYVYWLASFAEALRGVTDIDILRRPFFRNTGYFALYTHPPYSPRGAFGDGGYHPPSAAERMLIEFLADSFRDPVLKWHAQSIKVSEEPGQGARWREWFMEDAVALWRAAAGAGVHPEPPAKLDGSRWLADIGWAAMHSALGDPENDVWALFKASRFGSFSHSHGDQNTFIVNAYGRALAIDSGYYPWYGSPHDELWTRQTWAHNGILVNGRGQPPHTWAAGGRIESYERDGVVTIVRGQAANGYNLPQPGGIARLWSRTFNSPMPPLEPRVESFERTLAFIGDKTRPLIIVFDDLRAAAPAAFDWLLHALNRMDTDEGSGAITIRDGGARLAVRLASTVPFRFSQRTGFPVAPEFAENTAYVTSAEERKSRFPNQWHLKATTRKPVREVRFLAVMAPCRGAEPEPAIEKTASGAFRVAGWHVSAADGKLEVRRE